MESNWQSIAKLREPFNDAYNYRSKEEKEFFNKIFLRTDNLDKCLLSATYYLIGEKGSGKTAYAVYLENNPPAGYRCKVTTMTETQYKKFIELKRQGKLAYSDYANIWRSIVLFVVSQMLVEKSKTILDSFTGKFRAVEKAVKRWNGSALNPEIEAAFQAVTDTSLEASLGKESVGKVGAKAARKETSNSTVMSYPLLATESTLKEAIADLKLTDNHILFIDGIDHRPEKVPYVDYVECVKGLAEAVWQLNTEFFHRIKDSKGRIKVVLLVRPDVFHKLNLYNSNSRIQDNAVFLDWATTDREFPESYLYEASGKYFSSQQNHDELPATAWSQYFPSPNDPGRAFKRILRTSFQKPRDVLTIIKILRAQAIKSGRGDGFSFDPEALHNARFTKEYSDYLLGEVRNYSAFYMPQEDFSLYLKFFQYLDGHGEFSFESFTNAYNLFLPWIKGENVKAKEYIRDPEALLQFFYDVNVIGYKEKAEDDTEVFHHWAYRERSLNNVAPKVKLSAQLILNPGIAKALDIGKQMSAHKSKESNDHLRSTHPKSRRRPRNKRR